MPLLLADDVTGVVTRPISEAKATLVGVHVGRVMHLRKVPMDGGSPNRRRSSLRAECAPCPEGARWSTGRKRCDDPGIDQLRAVGEIRRGDQTAAAEASRATRNKDGNQNMSAIMRDRLGSRRPRHSDQLGDGARSTGFTLKKNVSSRCTRASLN